MPGVLRGHGARPQELHAPPGIMPLQFPVYIISDAMICFQLVLDCTRLLVVSPYSCDIIIFPR